MKQSAPVLPSSGGSYTYDASGKLVQTEAPTKPPKRHSEIQVERAAEEAAKAAATKSAIKAKE